MKEIKFRAWDKVNKRYIYIADESNDTAIWFDENGWYVVETFTGSPVELFSHVNGVLEQSTGLKDKNGKEIYHKDIVRTPNGILVIEWNQLHNCWALFKNGSMRKEIISDWVNEDGTTPVQWEVKEFEVIGNKFENPELLD